MPSMLHEGISELFRDNPMLFTRLAGSWLPIPEGATVRREDSVFHDIQSAEYFADGVLSVRDAEDRAERAGVFEVQLGRDPDKLYSWPVYVTNARYRLRCPVTLIVVAIDHAIARWAAQPIDTGHDGFVLYPVVIGPDRIPVVTDAGEARAMPELAVLSAVAHGRDAGAADIALAALGAAAGLDNSRSGLYADLVYASLGDAARIALEALMQQGNYEYQSDFAKHYIALGEAKGRSDGEAAGETKGKTEGLLLALDIKGFAVSDGLRAHILGCRDLARLDTWYGRVKDATSLADIFDSVDPALLEVSR